MERTGKDDSGGAALRPHTVYRDFGWPAAKTRRLTQPAVASVTPDAAETMTKDDVRAVFQKRMSAYASHRGSRSNLPYYNKWPVKHDHISAIDVATNSIPRCDAQSTPNSPVIVMCSNAKVSSTKHGVVDAPDVCKCIAADTTRQLVHLHLDHIVPREMLWKAFNTDMGTIISSDTKRAQLSGLLDTPFPLTEKQVHSRVKVAITWFSGRSKNNKLGVGVKDLSIEFYRKLKECLDAGQPASRSKVGQHGYTMAWVAANLDINRMYEMMYTTKNIKVLCAACHAAKPTISPHDMKTITFVSPARNTYRYFPRVHIPSCSIRVPRVSRTESNLSNSDTGDEDDEDDEDDCGVIIETHQSAPSKFTVPPPDAVLVASTVVTNSATGHSITVSIYVGKMCDAAVVLSRLKTTDIFQSAFTAISRQTK